MKEFMGTEEFYSTLESNEYGRKYLDLIRRAQAEQRGMSIEEGYERHHIHPKSMGGVKSLQENGVKLTTFEHCQAHVFLAKAFPCYKTLRMISALSRNQITQVSDLDRLTLEEVYGWSELREQSVKLHSEKLKGHPVSEESTRKRLETRRRRGIKSQGRPKGSKNVRKYIILWKDGIKKGFSPEDVENLLKNGYTKSRKESLKVFSSQEKSLPLE